MGFIVRDALSFIQDLMREMDEKEGVFKSVQNKGEQLICKNHPAKATIEVSLLCLPSLVSIREAEDFRLFAYSMVIEKKSQNLIFLSLAGVQSCYADTVELDSAALLLCRATSEGEHCLF